MEFAGLNNCIIKARWPEVDGLTEKRKEKDIINN